MSADDLSHKKCVPCEQWMPPLKGDAVKPYLTKLTLEWEVVDDMKIKHMFTFKDFKEAMRFVNGVADIANVENHHPDIFISYSKVKIILWTHFIKGLHENDFIMARKIEKLFESQFKTLPEGK